MSARTRRTATLPWRATRILLSLALALPLAGAAAGSRAQVRNPDDTQAGGRLAGTWEFQVTFRNCQTGDALGPAFTSLHTYFPGGSAIEQGATAGPPPAVSRSVGQGVWGRKSTGLFEGEFSFFVFDSTGQNLSRIVIEEMIEFDGRDDVTHYGVGKVFLPNGTQVATNCFTGPGRRLGL